MKNKILITATIFGLTSIILGAFGAHALKKLLTLEQLQSFEIGVRYQMYHALFLLYVGSADFLTEKTKKILFYFIFIGVLMFSGSIYLLSTCDISGINFNPLAILTPLGGALLILGWSILLIRILNKKS
jgi:uncharacterized membrane protein YgdD (TMEM256/DUF423 family)